MSTKHTTSLANERSPERLEAFSDGVFAVAITLLGINIAVPEEKILTAHPLLETLLSMWPVYLGYVTSFVVIGLFWANHHYMFRYIKRTNHFLLLLNTLTLMFLALIPFATSLLTKEAQLAHPQQDDLRLAVLIYGSTMLLTSSMYNVLWWYAARGMRLIDTGLSQKIAQKIGRRYLLSIPLYLLAMVISLLYYNVILILYIAIALFYAFPAKHWHLRKSSQSSEDAANQDPSLQ